MKYFNNVKSAIVIHQFFIFFGFTKCKFFVCCSNTHWLKQCMPPNERYMACCACCFRYKLFQSRAILWNLFNFKNWNRKSPIFPSRGAFILQLLPQTHYIIIVVKLPLSRQHGYYCVSISGCYGVLINLTYCYFVVDCLCNVPVIILKNCIRLDQIQVH